MITYALFDERSQLYYRGSKKHPWHKQGILFTDPTQLRDLASMLVKQDRSKEDTLHVLEYKDGRAQAVTAFGVFARLLSSTPCTNLAEKAVLTKEINNERSQAGEEK
jgi:hypothetical protein